MPEHSQRAGPVNNRRFVQLDWHGHKELAQQEHVPGVGEEGWDDEGQEAVVPAGDGQAAQRRVITGELVQVPVWLVTASNVASHWNGTIGANGGSVSFGLSCAGQIAAYFVRRSGFRALPERHATRYACRRR